MRKLKGLYTALVTPFQSEGTLDEEGLRRNIRFQIQQGVNGLVVLGTTGEAPTLTSQERQKIIEIARQEVKLPALLIVGTGSYSTAQTIALTQQAQELGADVALVVTPYYNKPTQEGLYRHFAALCEAVSLPICLYSIQGRTALNLQPETLKRLAALPSIIGIKEGSSNIVQMMEMIENVSQQLDHFSVISSDDILTLPLLALGGHGVISVVSNLVPGPMRAFIDAALAGNYTLAREWHYKLMPLFVGAFIETNPSPIKTAMEFCQMAAGPCRLPLCELSAGNYEKLKQIIHTLPPQWLEGYGQA